MASARSPLCWCPVYYMCKRHLFGIQKQPILGHNIPPHFDLLGLGFFFKVLCYPRIYNLVLQIKPFAFELFFCLANAGFFTFSSKTRSIIPTSNLCRNIQRPKSQLNQ